MKRYLALGLSTVFALPVLSAPLVLAHGTEAQHEKETAATQDISKRVAELAPPQQPAAEDIKARLSRIEKHKALHKVRLTTAEKLNIQAKCKSAQGNVSSVTGRAKGIETSRTAVYTNIVKRLTDLSTKLKNKGHDTQKLDTEIQALQGKITTFNTDLATYKQTIADVADMDCKTDAEGFKASLTAARTALEAVQKDSAAVRTHVKDVIKPELKTIRGSLDSAKTEGSE